MGFQPARPTIIETNSMTKKEIAANAAAAGIVKTQAHTILPATRHLTADRRVVDPTPAIAPVIVCVVDTGIPAAVAPNKVIAPAVSAQKPPTGRGETSYPPGPASSGVKSNRRPP